MKQLMAIIPQITNRMVYMAAGAFVWMTLVQVGCTRPMLPGDRYDDDRPIEKLSHLSPDQIRFKQR